MIIKTCQPKGNQERTFPCQNVQCTNIVVVFSINKLNNSKNNRDIERTTRSQEL